MSCATDLIAKKCETHSPPPPTPSPPPPSPLPPFPHVPPAASPSPSQQNLEQNYIIAGGYTCPSGYVRITDYVTCTAAGISLRASGQISENWVLNRRPLPFPSPLALALPVSLLLRLPSVKTPPSFTAAGSPASQNDDGDPPGEAMNSRRLAHPSQPSVPSVRFATAHTLHSSLGRRMLGVRL